MKRILLATTAMCVLGAASSAVAADLPRRMEMPAKAPDIPAPMFSWTGFYVGINGGGELGRSRYDFPGGPSDSFNLSGGLVGGTAGYNLQTGPIVFGLEGDIDWASASGGAACNGGTLTCQTRNDWLATARGRVGYTIDRLLPYVTGGAAFGSINSGTAGFGSVNPMRTGWTLGGGLEYAFLPNWSAKLEYLYVDLGGVDCGTACGGIVPTSNRFTTNVVRAGLNYRF